MRCVAKGKCRASLAAERCNVEDSEGVAYPINCVSLRDAIDYCGFQGARVPTQEEWTWAASGHGAGNRYPWGNAIPTSQLCWSGNDRRQSKTCAVHSFPAGDTSEGIADLAGNVAEWTTSARPLEAGKVIVMGGAFGIGSEAPFRVDAITFEDELARNPLVGFRCVSDPDG
jgi:formylglycine-generating enzyme required for sulfatase activity